MALRRPPAAARICTAKKVCLTVLATSTVSGVWPLAAKARSSVAELQKQLTTAKKEVEAAEQRADAAEQQADAAKQQADAAKKQADAAKKQAKIRIWVGTALSYLVLIFVAGVVTGIVPRIISSKLPPSVAEFIKQALYR
ncbi:hypothetical protein CHLRE_02g076650v5 [Chlamydomonas reinhardtii]|uniref:Uncharacterized protein n=1 Tax=Chlamydomonas reinhardtii TaxID=3055 RepID=A8IA60_CHLRE|nr:uncharacterized protein CHLRE_02g076650v5 [Chlamydomonas reinhardtii]PNW86195.1 hypothetical protein CHLRE_02g076650v5 [Chlamydomonas reinhardtii]|eukprot:XP_001701642.1 predicted protein [Chlamydomonas reinhardtii]